MGSLACYHGEQYCHPTTIGKTEMPALHYGIVGMLPRRTILSSNDYWEDRNARTSLWDCWHATTANNIVIQRLLGRQKCPHFTTASFVYDLLHIMHSYILYCIITYYWQRKRQHVPSYLSIFYKFLVHPICHQTFKTTDDLNFMSPTDLWIRPIRISFTGVISACEKSSCWSRALASLGAWNG